MQDFYSFDVAGLGGARDILKPLRGKLTLAVNVASKCGYTPQYAGLEALYRELKEQNFTVLGFPCNQFGAQEPGTAADIQNFCAVNYAVSFPLAAKIDVNGAERHPLYAWLTSPQNGFPGDVAWNFEKFLIDRTGKVVARYPSGTKAQDAGLLQDLAELI
jgi:glutathione peroxidase